MNTESIQSGDFIVNTDIKYHFQKISKSLPFYARGRDLANQIAGFNKRTFKKKKQTLAKPIG